MMKFEKIQNTKTDNKINAMNEIYSKSFKYYKVNEIDDTYLVQQLTNKFYDSIVKNINDSADKGKFYCVMEFEKHYFMNLSLNKDKVDPNIIVHKLFKYMGNPHLTVNQKKVPYLGTPLKYSIIPNNLILRKDNMFTSDSATFYKNTNIKRKNLMIEFRWGQIPEKRKKFFNNFGSNITSKNEMSLRTDNKYYPLSTRTNNKYYPLSTQVFNNMWSSTTNVSSQI